MLYFSLLTTDRKEALVNTSFPPSCAYRSLPRFKGERHRAQFSTEACFLLRCEKSVWAGVLTGAGTLEKATQPPRNLPPLFPGLSVFTLWPWALLLPGGRVLPTHFRGAASASSATFRPSCKI